MSSLSTQLIDTFESLEGLMPEWHELWRRSGAATVFQSPEWLLPWCQAFAPGDLCTIAIRAGRLLIALAPLYREDGTYGHRLLPLGIGNSDYLDVLIDPAYQELGARALSKAISETGGVDQCELTELHPSAAGLNLLPPAGWDQICSAASVCAVLPLPEFAHLPDVIPPSRLRHLRNARNRAARRGEIEIVSGDSEAAALLKELVRLHESRWNSAGRGAGIFGDPRVRQFHMMALPGLLVHDLVRLDALKIDGSVVAVYYGLQAKGRSSAYICGYDPAFAFESPGSILIGHAIEQALREGMQEFDFLRGQEPYKYQWGARDRANLRRVFLRQSRRQAYG